MARKPFTMCLQKQEMSIVERRKTVTEDEDKFGIYIHADMNTRRDKKGRTSGSVPNGEEAKLASKYSCSRDSDLTHPLIDSPGDGGR